MSIEFALASLALIVLPGPDQALITRNALVGGRTAGLRTMLGGASGLTLLAAQRPSDHHEQAPGGRPFAQGFVSNALNPKVALFFLTFVPQFLPEHGATLPTALALSLTFAAIYLAWFSGLVTLVELVGNALRRPRVQAWTERVTGGALVAFGLRLAAAGKP
jgi:threonine/homoserine/homoserine lactone efflux protein